MKIHARKKAYRRKLQEMAKAGMMNTADGKMIARNHCKDDGMRKDYYPQGQA